MPVVPLQPAAQCDFIPVDLVASSIAAVVATPEYGRTYWLTGGPDALTIKDMFTVGRPFADAMGRDLDAVKLVSPEEMTALIDTLPRRLKERMVMMMELSNVMARERPFPSDICALLGQGALSTEILAETLSVNLRWWGDQKGVNFKTPECAPTAKTF